MAWLERRGDRFRAVFRFRGQWLNVTLKAADEREAKSCLARLEENLRLVERGRMAVPPGADLGLFLLSDGKLEQAVEVARPVRLVEVFDLYRTEFTAGAKEAFTREMEDIHLNHLTRILGGETPVATLNCSPECCWAKTAQTTNCVYPNGKESPQLGMSRRHACIALAEGSGSSSELSDRNR